ncbi:MAG: restriction endonuclease [Firmicutes bacterium]|nr:restriction endonuclease [Bacillota bacterium]
MLAGKLTGEIKNIRIWQKGDERAPHKPLLLLYTLGRVSRDEPRLAPYSEAREDLRKLLIEFGPYRRAYYPSYPFVKLCNDGDFWEIKGKQILNTTKDWTDRELIDNETAGGFAEGAYTLLRNDRKLLNDLARFILDNYFPGTLHQDILAQVGLELESDARLIRRPDFRDRVLRAYEYRCAVCGFNVRLGDTLVAVEAAHIKWHCYGGPDHEVNGIALCSLHHRLFDRGAFTLDSSYVLRVAENAHGTCGFKEWLMRYHDHPIRRPQSPAYYPSGNYINWHLREVFRGPSRYAARG